MQNKSSSRDIEMIPDGNYTAVVDEIEGSRVRLELQAADDELYELVVEGAELPNTGKEVGAVLSVEVVDEIILDAEYDAKETDHRRQQAQDRFDRLSDRPPDNE
jgi:hypothetical protein